MINLYKLKIDKKQINTSVKKSAAKHIIFYTMVVPFRNT